jgi:tetratricopeptide (TPR) repeat protein
MAGGQVRQLTNLELIKRAEEYSESLELEKAVALYDEGLQRFPNDTVILDGYSELLIQLGEEEKAKKVRKSLFKLF